MAVDSRAYTWGHEDQAFVASEHLAKAGHFGPWKTGSSMEQLWQEAEIRREASLCSNARGLFARLRCRAFLVARSLSILPGQKVLELGAGSGIWTEHLAHVLAGQNSIKAAVFDENLAQKARRSDLPNTTFVHIRDFQQAFSKEEFDCIVGMDILNDELYLPTLAMVYRWLKPGGQFVFFAQNPSNPVGRLGKALGSIIGRERLDNSNQSVLLQRWTDTAVRLGFGAVETTRREVICPRPVQPSAGQAVGLILERAPIAGCFSKVVSFKATKPATALKEFEPQVSLATHRRLFGAVSVVVPCHNEETNVPRLVKTLLGMYGDYTHEIVIVDDNSTDETANVAAAVGDTEPRVKVVRRSPPGGVGRALRDGYAAASGRYILSIDCDFANIASEFTGLFDAVAEGFDGAIGSRFSSESALVCYPLSKILCNRGYHLVLNLLLGKHVRDISNNLKIYRADILKDLDIEEDGFAANVETGLKPILLNYRIREVPASWINRTADMGKSSFSLLKVGPDYLRVLLRTTWKFWWGRYRSNTVLPARSNCPRVH